MKVSLSDTNTLRKSLQTTSVSPYRTQVQLTASFLVCFLIFIEYKLWSRQSHSPCSDLWNIASRLGACIFTSSKKKPHTICYSGIPATDSMELKQQLHDRDCLSILAWCNQHHARF